MKTFNFLIFIIVVSLVGVLFYQNMAYFMATSSLSLDLRVSNWNWTFPAIQNAVYFGICFLLGLFISGTRGWFAKYRLKKEIRKRDASIESLNGLVNTLKTELEVFKHDPYIKKGLEEIETDRSHTQSNENPGDDLNKDSIDEKKDGAMESDPALDLQAQDPQSDPEPKETK
jgi:hypothetical protein